MRREVTGAQRARFARPCRGNIRGARVFAQRRLPGSATRSKSMKRALVLALTLRSRLATIVPAQAAARPAPDAHTILVAPVTTLAMAPSVHKPPPYDPVKDFAPIRLVGSAQFALVANPQAPAATLPELIAFIRNKNGGVHDAASGAPPPHHPFIA